MANVDEVTRFICLFHDAGRAHAAVQALNNAAFVRGSVATVGAADGSPASSLEGLGVPERDLAHLRDGLGRGGIVVSLEASEDHSDEIERIFHKYSAEKIDETELQTEPVTPVAPLVDPVARSAAGNTVIPIAEEELLVGKREVDRGGVRVYRRTVEEPVNEAVDLHEERVVLQYREVNRPATEADVRAGSQEIELIETAEVPVVQKVARVVEEVRVGKTETDRTEVIQDTVRHTEVDVEPIETEVSRSKSLRE